VKAVLRNALKPSVFPALLRKATERLHYGFDEAPEAERWARENARDMAVWACEIDADLWSEAATFGQQLRERGDEVLARLRAGGIDLGGGMPHELLYFLVRLRRPKHVLETGVAAGWSTTAILSALEANGEGTLFSSDLPYFRIDRPERFIGVLVPEGLKHRWVLATHGDRRNLRSFLAEGRSFSLVHYDSDKSRPGREWFTKRIADHLSHDGVIVWDDIHNNLHFRDRAREVPARVLEYRGRMSGVERAHLLET
jgi:predicted O-methyltransferase YrrM